MYQEKPEQLKFRKEQLDTKPEQQIIWLVFADIFLLKHRNIA